MAHTTRGQSGVRTMAQWYAVARRTAVLEGILSAASADVQREYGYGRITTQPTAARLARAYAAMARHYAIHAASNDWQYGAGKSYASLARTWERETWLRAYAPYTLGTGKHCTATHAAAILGMPME